MKKSTLLIAFIAISLISSAQRKKISDDDIRKAGHSMQKFAKQQNTATTFYVIGTGVTLLGAFSTNSAGTRSNNGFLVLGPIATGIGWIIDRSSFKYLKQSGLYLSENMNGLGMSLGYRF